MTYYNQKADRWLKSHPGQRIQLPEMTQILNTSYLKAATPGNATNGFKCTGIVPLNRDVWTEEDFVVAKKLTPVELEVGSVGDVPQSTVDIPSDLADRVNNDEHLANVHAHRKRVEGYRVVPTYPHGRCLFRSIAICINEPLQSCDRDQLAVPKKVVDRLFELGEADRIRAGLVAEMALNVELLRPIFEPNFDQSTERWTTLEARI
jgi:hypothetical protein